MEERIERFDRVNENEDHERDEIHSKTVRAGKRTYFFDVKATRKNDYYLTITESKKRFNREGRFFYEKHKIFLYKEDFEKFSESLSEMLEYIKRENPYIPAETDKELEEDLNTEFVSVDFDDLEKN